MLFFLRTVRRKLMQKNKFTTYLLYALGETVLVVIGILIAVQINDLNKKQERKKLELDSYALILSDLRKDSVTYRRYMTSYTRYLDLYFEINRINLKKIEISSDLYLDYLVSNISFSPVTQENHRNTIELMTDREIREQLNGYFSGLTNIEITVEEFNQYIRDVSRPYFMGQINVLNNEVVFDEEDRTFPPFKGKSALDHQKMASVIAGDECMAIVGGLRMSIGAYLAFLEIAIERNYSLIKTLEQKLN